MGNARLQASADGDTASLELGKAENTVRASLARAHSPTSLSRPNGRTIIAAEKSGRWHSLRLELSDLSSSSNTGSLMAFQRSGLPTRFRGRLCFPAKLQDGAAQGQGDPQYSAAGFQPSSRSFARLQPLIRECLAVFPRTPTVSSHLDEISDWQPTKCRSSWKATLLRDG